MGRLGTLFSYYYLLLNINFFLSHVRIKQKNSFLIVPARLSANATYCRRIFYSYKNVFSSHYSTCTGITLHFYTSFSHNNITHYISIIYIYRRIDEFIQIHASQTSNKNNNDRRVSYLLVLIWYYNILLLNDTSLINWIRFTCVLITLRYDNFAGELPH